MMYSAIYLAVILQLCRSVLGQESEHQLSMKPTGRHVRPLGGSIMFTCELSGSTSEVTLRWLAKATGETDWREITSQTTASRYVDVTEAGSVSKLYITSVTNDDAGLFRCNTTIDSQELSQEVELQVFKEIAFEYAPHEQHPKIYTDALINCSVTGEPAPEVSWIHGGYRIRFGGRWVMLDGGLKILNITKDDNGIYVCRAEVSSEGRYNEQKINVTVYVPPSITAGPETVTHTQGDSFTISCAADGIPQPTYFFTKDSSDEHLNSNDRVTVDSYAGHIQFKELLKSDEGQYTCQAVNEVGETSATGDLTVLVKPSIYRLENVVGIEGESAELICQSHGSPRPKLTFQKAGTEVVYQLGDSENGKFIVSVSGDDGISLTLNDLQPVDTALYTCHSVSNIGTDEKTASLTVSYKPRFEEVANVAQVVYAWAGKERNLTCQASGEPSPQLKWFLNGELLESNAPYHIFDLGTTSYLQVSIREIDQPSVYGTYTCQASNTVGSADLMIELQRAAVPSSPTDVKSTRVWPTRIELDVGEPEDNGGIPISGYRVACNRTDDLKFNTGDEIIVTNLEPNMTYTFFVSALNEVGAGSPFEFTETTAPTRRPNPVTVTSDVSGRSPYEYTVSWAVLDDGGLPITEVMLKVRPVGNDSDWKSFKVDIGKEHPVHEYRLKALLEKTRYELQVLVRNDIDWSEPNDYFVFTTSEALEVNRETSVAAAHMSFLGVGAVIGVVIVVLFILLAIIDVSCYFVNGCGVTSIICSKVRGHKSSASDKEKEMEQGEGGEQVVKSQSPQYETVSIPVAQTATETEQTKLPESPAVSDNQDENKPLLPASQDVADSEPTEVTKDNIESPKEPLNLLSAEDRDNEAKGAIEEVGLTDNPKQPLNYQTEGKPDA